jgi:DNA repair exonuclease SbcCD nuclease subunit
MGAIQSIDGDVWSDELPPVISGHIHDNQTINNIYYPGSAMQHSFGETGKNIISYVEFNPDNHKYFLEEIDLKLPRKKIVYVKAVDAVSIEVPVMKEGDKVRMTVSGNQDDFKAFKKSNKYKKLVDSGVKVVFKPTKSDIVLTHSEHDVTDFHEILRGLVEKTDLVHVKSVYENIINGK